MGGNHTWIQPDNGHYCGGILCEYVGLSVCVVVVVVVGGKLNTQLMKIL